MAWLSDGRKFLNENGTQEYKNGDKRSDSAKENKKLFEKEIEKTLGISNKEIILKKQGAKWVKQNQNTISSDIWYWSYYKSFGENYPVVLGFKLDKDGVDIAIQINNYKVSGADARRVLGQMIKKTYEKLNADTNEKFEYSQRDNEKDEPYEDIGFFKIKSEEDFERKSKIVIKTYLEIVKKINNFIFEEMISEYAKLVKAKKSISHCHISKEDDFYKLKKKVRSQVDEFINDEANPTEGMFINFWNRNTINSAQQASSARNVLDRNGGIESLQSKVKELVEIELKEATEDKIFKVIDSSKNSALELYYYYHMANDNSFPLLNGGVSNALKMLDKAEVRLDGTGYLDKLKGLQSKVKCIDDCTIEPSFLVDQFLNLVDKIKYEDIKNVGGAAHEKLYCFAYLLTYWQKQHKTNNEEEFESLLKKSKNIVFYGAPGTGKTYTAEKNIQRIIEENSIENYKNSERFNKIQFHPSYSYEDFIEGLKPRVTENNQVTLELVPGYFSKFCDTAKEFESEFVSSRESLKYAFFFLVDEINRAELSRVLGELMYCLDKRGETIRTQYAYLKKDDDAGFLIPKNLFFIGTMNDVDRSIDSFDIALRRRFLWSRMDCDYQVILNELSDIAGIGEFGKDDKPESGYVKACFELNQFIIEAGGKKLGMGKLYEIGHSYFMNIRNYIKTPEEGVKKGHLSGLFDDSIAPLLKEYIRSEVPENQLDDIVNAAKKAFQLPVKKEKSS